MKPLGHRAYGSIPHLPGSKLGTGDHHINEGQAKYLTESKPSKNHQVVVQTKLDGSCLSVAKIGGELVPIGRSGYLVASAPYAELREFLDYVEEYKDRFDRLLNEGERVVGEWVKYALSTKYVINSHRQLFRPFDIMVGHERIHWRLLDERVCQVGFRPVDTLSVGEAVPVDVARALQNDPNAEGLVYRMENLKNGRVEYLAKWVRSDYEPGKLMMAGEMVPNEIRT